MPVSAVLARSSLNIASGATSRFSGVFQAASVAAVCSFAPQIISILPVASLSGIMWIVAYRLALPSQQLFQARRLKMLPWTATLLTLYTVDLSAGVVFGSLISAVIAMHDSGRSVLSFNFTVVEQDNTVKAARSGPLNMFCANKLEMLEADLLYHIEQVAARSSSSSPTVHVEFDCANLQFVDVSGADLFMQKHDRLVQACARRKTPGKILSTFPPPPQPLSSH